MSPPSQGFMGGACLGISWSSRRSALWNSPWLTSPTSPIILESLTSPTVFLNRCGLKSAVKPTRTSSTHDGLVFRLSTSNLNSNTSSLRRHHHARITFTKVGTTSLVWRYRFFNQDNQLVWYSTQTTVCVDMDTMEPQTIPDDVRKGVLLHIEPEASS